MATAELRTDVIPPECAEPEPAYSWRELGRALKRPRQLLGELAARVSDHDVFTNAAALAYFFFLSALPFVLFLVSLGSILPIDGVVDWVLANMSRSLPPDAFQVIAGTVQEVLGQPRGGLLSLGAILALWTASNAFGAIMNGLNRAYGVHDGRPWWKARLHAVWLTVALGVLLIVSFVLAVFGGPVVQMITARLGPVAGVTAFVVRWGVVLGAVMLTVAAIYYAAPSIERDWQWIRPGAVLFTMGFLLSSAVFSLYVTNFGSYDATYGSLGAIIILLFWLYLLGLFLLLGGEMNAMLEERIKRRSGRVGSQVRAG
jgi:membrane protein